MLEGILVLFSIHESKSDLINLLKVACPWRKIKLFAQIPLLQEVSLVPSVVSKWTPVAPARLSQGGKKTRSFYNDFDHTRTTSPIAFVKACILLTKLPLLCQRNAWQAFRCTIGDFLLKIRRKGGVKCVDPTIRLKKYK